jgi:protein TonB
MAFLMPISMLYSQSKILIPAENHGGKSAINSLIKNEMVYPEASRNAGVEGTVALSFTVKNSGETDQVMVTQTVSREIDAEALRLFKHLLWNPAINTKGETVDSEQEVSIKFKLKKYLKYVKQRGYDTIEYPHQPIDTSLKIYEVDQLSQMPTPVYADSQMKFVDFLMQNMKYPDLAKKQGVSGIVEVFFVVEPSGKVSNVTILQGVGGGCSEEAIRLMGILNWYPGLVGDMAVRTAMTLKITFNLDDSENMKYVPSDNNSQM